MGDVGPRRAPEVGDDLGGPSASAALNPPRRRRAAGDRPPRLAAEQEQCGEQEDEEDRPLDGEEPQRVLRSVVVHGEAVDRAEQVEVHRRNVPAPHQTGMTGRPGATDSLGHMTEPMPQRPGARAASPRHPGGHHRAGIAALTLGALGVVFGDIGTSPLYALQTVFHADHGEVPTSPTAVYGVLSLVFWAVTIIVSIKYVTFIMRADNDGEGGIMALIALIQRAGLAAALDADRADRARHLRRGAVLRRRHDHARDLGAVRGRGARGGRRRRWSRSWCRSRWRS